MCPWGGVLLVMLAGAGCGRLGFGAAGDAGPAVDGAATDGGGGDGGAPCAWGPWSTPVELTALNSAADDLDPSLSPDGRTLYFCSTRDGAEYDIWTSTRASVGAPWSPPVLVPALATASQNECNPDVSADGLELYFGVGTVERVTRASVGDAWGFTRELIATTDATHTGPIGPDLSGDMLALYYGARPPADTVDRLYRITRAARGAAFGDPVLLPGQSAAEGGGFPAIAADERELVYSIQTALAGWDLGVLTRADAAAELGEPQPITELNTAASEADAELSADGTTLMFTSTRRAGSDWDLFEATRACQ